MEKGFLFAGFGGQGILTAGMLLANIGAMQNREVTWIPSYGSEMRGGTANCMVKIGDRPIASPFVKEIDILVAMNEPSCIKFLPKLKAGGFLIVNSSIVKKIPCSKNIMVVEIPANDLCKELNYERGVNICMLGALATIYDSFDKQSYVYGIEQYFSKRKHLNESNIAAFNAGYNHVSKEVV